MAEISASMVMDLRQRTGLGMMECKKALTEAGGDLAKAEDLLRIKSGAKASKAAGRIAAEGVIGLYVAPDAKTAAMIEVNCETDFVAQVTTSSGRLPPSSRRSSRVRIRRISRRLRRRTLASGETVETRRVALVQKIGENMSLRRFTRRERRRQAGVPTSTADGSACWWTSPAARTRSARIWRCTWRRASRWR